ncbi:hypothetical protein ES677_00280 [Bizionia gelidisalsuginis]|uniref:Uncharacterized protein n=2 Tax=Bizionia TaxID=283785 RepID=A0A8H2QG51_9FLAO|nr:MULTISPECIES: hypothetical protein [Bizionia]TYB77472.1 hypothetical protein ES676_04030 [Bizionia saleffrena]TYC17847.1 hypothetical protein ES677_00280 [Bizionia gelidisalsuginis]
MELGMTIISATLLLLIIVPLTLMQLKKRNKEQLLLKSLKTLSNQQNCKLTKYDVTSDFAIGLDQATKTLFYYKNTVLENISKHVNLSQFLDCEVLEVRQNNTRNKQGDIENLNLVLHPIDKNGTVETLKIYNSKENYQLNGEVDLTKKWKDLISLSIK